jgi:hypothetical protein
MDNEKTEPWLTELLAHSEQSATVSKIKEAFGLSPEPAMMMLRGLEASGVKDVDRWLLRHATTPSPGKMRDVVDKLMREGLRPGRTITWTQFYVRVRDEGGGWRNKKKGLAAFGFNDRTIRRYIQNA